MNLARATTAVVLLIAKSTTGQRGLVAQKCAGAAYKHAHVRLRPRRAVARAASRQRQIRRVVILSVVQPIALLATGARGARARRCVAVAVVRNLGRARLRPRRVVVRAQYRKLQSRSRAFLRGKIVS